MSRSQLRSSEVARPFSTLKRRVEHEALALRTVRDGGTRCPRVIGVGVTPGGAAFVVEEFIVGHLEEHADQLEALGRVRGS